MIRISDHQPNSSEWRFLSKMKEFIGFILDIATLSDLVNSPWGLLTGVCLVSFSFWNFIFCSTLAGIARNFPSFALLCLVSALSCFRSFIAPILWWIFSIWCFRSFSCFVHSRILGHLRTRIENKFSLETSCKNPRNWWISFYFRF